MSVRFKFLPLAIAILLAVFAVWPARTAKAAYLTEFNIDKKGKNYIIAGMEYKASFRDDAHFTTKKKIEMSFSTRNNYTLSFFQAPYSLSKDGTLRFTIPYDPMITNVSVGLHVSFNPVLGETTKDNLYITSMPVYQPMDPSDLEAIANDDGTVTLNWYDNSNMESRYVIIRSGPDGDKQFTVDNTMATVGPLTFTDKTTNKDKDTIYMYKLNMMIDIEKFQGTGFQYEPVNVYRLVKTKAPALRSKDFKIDQTFVPKLPEPSTSVTKPTLKDLIVRNDLVLNNTYQHIVDQLNKEGKVIPGVENDLVPVTSVRLGSKSLSIQPGDQVALLSTVVPDNAANKKVSWESSNPAVAKVDDDGKVTGVTPGTAKITVKTDEGGFVAVCIVTVNEPATELAGILHENENKLTDISEHPAKAEIITAVDLGIVSGYTDHTFKPERNISRAEFATMLMRAISSNEAVEALAFNDKDKIEEWAAAPIAKAVKLGIITGYSDGTFRPEANITHAEMITMVVRASNLSPDTAAKSTFADDSDIPAWAKPAVATAQLNGIIIVGGKPNGKFGPAQLSTRAEAASAIIKMLTVKK